MFNQTYTLTAGTHRLYVHYRENGAKLDKIYIGSPNACTPEGVAGESANCIPKCTAGTICDDGDGCTFNDVYDNNCNCSGTLFDENNDNICDCVDVQLKVWLEGAYDFNTNQMTTNLHTRGLLPGQTPSSPLATPTLAGQPYHTVPWKNNKKYRSCTNRSFADERRSYRIRRSLCLAFVRHKSTLYRLRTSQPHRHHDSTTD